MNEIISLIVNLGVPGFLTYVLLSKINVISFTKNNKDEKVMFISAISIINVAVVYLVLECLNVEFMSVKGVLVSVLSTILLSILIYPLIIFLLRKSINLLLEKTNQKQTSNKTIIDRIYDDKPKTKKHIEVFVYTFEHEYIISGYLAYFSNIDSKLIFDSNGINYLDYNDFIQEFNKSDDTIILFDSDSKNLLYIIYR